MELGFDWNHSRDDNSSSSPDDDSEAHTQKFVYSFSIVLSTLLTLSIVLNLISVVTIVAARAFTSINLLIMNLAAADLTYTLGIPMFISHNFVRSWPFGELGCQLFIGADFGGIVVGILTVAALSVERYIEVVDKRMHTRRRLSAKCKNALVVAYCCFTWLVALAVTLPFVRGIRLITTPRGNLINSTI